MSEVLAQRWLDFLAAERGLSPLTLRHYTRDITHLLTHFAQQDLSQLQAGDIRALMGSLHQSGLSGRSLARMLSAWRNFFQFLVTRHQHPHNPCDGLRPPRFPYALPHHLTVDQTQLLLDTANKSDPLYKRDQALFELLYSAGLRLSELATLSLDQLDLAQQEVRVTGKGNKTRIVPLGIPAIRALQDWLACRADPVSFVFPGRRPNTHISPRTIQNRLGLRSLQTGLNEHVHPHMLRHAFASHLLQSSSDLRAVQELLGHARIGTTQIYTRLDYQHLARVYDLAHPRANLDKTKKNR